MTYIDYLKLARFTQNAIFDGFATGAFAGDLGRNLRIQLRTLPMAAPPF